MRIYIYIYISIYTNARTQTIVVLEPILGHMGNVDGEGQEERRKE